MDGAAFPHIIKVKYTIGVKDYTCQKWIGAFFCCRSVELGSVHKRHYFFSSEESKLPKLVTPHRIKPMEKETTGTVISVTKQWWLKVNRKPVRTHAMDGASVQSFWYLPTFFSNCFFLLTNSQCTGFFLFICKNNHRNQESQNYCNESGENL